MDLLDLYNDTTEITAIYKHLTFLLTAFSDKLTPAYKASLLVLVAEAPAEGEGPKDEICLMLDGLVASWTDGEGQPILLRGEVLEPTYQNFYQLPYPLLAALLRAVTGHLHDLANPPQSTN